MRAHNDFVRWFYLFIVVSVVIEIAWYLFVCKREYPWREMLTSAALFVMRVPVRRLNDFAVAPVAYFLWSHRVTTIPLNTVWGLALLFLGQELAYYWMHRAGHQVRWMWASHVVHHSPEEIHLASAFRLSATELLSGSWLFYLPLFFLGFSPAAVGTMIAINLFYQFWLHTDLIGRLGPLEWVFNTPSHHRVHHASNDVYLDRNYGGILIVWDRLFGTFAAEQPEITIAYGLVHPVDTHNPLRLAFHEWMTMARDAIHAQSWRERMVSLFGRPGAAAMRQAPAECGEGP